MARAGGLLTAAVGISAVMSHFGGNTAVPSITSGKSGTVATAGGPVDEDSLEQVTKSFWATRPDDAVWTVIATVPDPEKTQLKLQFDRAVESIERAAFASGYILRQHWLPWEVAEHRESDDPKKRKEAKLDHQERVKQPGVLLFDKDAGEQLAIFLVGESPISGVDPDQLKEAVRNECHQQFKDFECHGRFKGFLGPEFSGSWSGLRTFATKHPEAYFYTSTTSQRRQDEFLKSAPNRILTTSYTTDLELKALGDYVAATWEIPSSPALVAEDETSFSESTASNASRYFKFKFPRELSHLRNAARDSASLTGPKRGEYDTGPLVALTLRENLQSADIPDFSKDQTPVSQESMLLQIAEEINRKHLLFSGVIATDPLDSLFINRFLHAACPNTRIFQTEPDILTAHGSDTADFEGMLTVSGFPLFSKLNEWGNKGAMESKLFPSAESASIYNNLVAMLTHDLSKNGAYYANPTDPRLCFPALWLSVLGRNGFWPVDVLKTDAKPANLLDDTPMAGTLEADNPTRLWWASFFLIILACFGIAFLDKVVAPTGDRRWTVFALKVDELGLPARAFWLYILSLALALLAGVWTIMPLRIWTAQHLHSTAAESVRVISIVCGVIATFTATLTSLRCASKIGKGKNFGNLEKEKAQAKFYLLVTAVSFCAFAGLITLGVRFVISPDLAPTFFLAYRSINLASGVSPLVPATFLLFGFCCYSYLNLKRVNFHVDRRPFVPELKGDLYCPNLHKLAAKICRRIYKPGWNKGDLTIGLSLATAGAFYVKFHAHQSVEPVRYENLFVTAVVLSIFLMAITCNRLFAIWLPFHEFLRNLERHPLRRGFGQLPKDFVWSPTWQGGSTQRTHVLISRSVDCLQSIIHCAKSPLSLRNSLPPYFDEMTEDVQTVLSASQEETRVSSTTYRRLQRKLQIAGEVIAPVLRSDLWSKGEYEARVEGGKSADESIKSGYEAAEQFLVYRYLAFINYVLIQQQNLITSMTILFLLLALALFSYPFLGRSLITGLITIAFSVLALSIAGIFSRLDRDPILSRATGTEGGKLDRYFFPKLLSYISLPLLTVLGSYFPTIGKFLFSWLVPAAEALH